MSKHTLKYIYMFSSPLQICTCTLVVDSWNLLQPDVVDTESLQDFKRRLDSTSLVKKFPH